MKVIRGKRALSMLLCAALFSTPAQASVVLADDPGGFGTGAVVRDTVSGQEWLNIGFTRGMSFNDVSGQLGPGGTFEGFRYATRAEIAAFWTNAGIPDLSGNGNPANYAPIQALLGLIGTNGCFGKCALALSADDATGGGDGSIRFTPSIQINDYGNGFANLTCCAQNVNTPHPGYSSWLVRPAVATLTSITVSPADPTIGVGQTQQFTATGTFSDGSTRILTPGPDAWTTKAPTPVPRAGGASGVIDGRLYLTAGQAGAGSVAATQVYDPASDSWTAKAPIPHPVSYPGAEAIDGKLYVVGGCFNTDCAGTTNLLQIYNSVTDTWTTGTPMPTPRNNMGTGVIDGKLYVVGGGQNCGTCGLNVLEVYDPTTDTWSSRAPMPTGRRVTAAVVDGILYALGGYSGSYHATVEAYSPDTDTWTAVASMPTAREFAHSSAAVVNGLLYAIGGENGIAHLSTSEVYDPADDTWSSLPPMPTGRYVAAARGIGGTAYVVGGLNGTGYLDNTEAFTAGDGLTWSSSDTGVGTIDSSGLATGNSPGTTTITATSASISGSTTLTVGDTTAPTISGLSVSPATLWPPNHKLVDVTVSYSASDDQSTPSCSLSVSSSEPVNGTGDGDTGPDWVVLGAHQLRLRAERAGGGTGRTYSIPVVCSDTSGNTTTGTVAVTVPKSQGK